MVQLLADANGVVILGRGLMAGIAMGCAAIGLGMVGANYMKALGRNPEAGKAANQLIIIAAMIEVTSLLAFLMASFLIK